LTELEQTAEVWSSLKAEKFPPLPLSRPLLVIGHGHPAEDPYANPAQYHQRIWQTP
jgi:hypothetical protein